MRSPLAPVSAEERADDLGRRQTGAVSLPQVAGSRVGRAPRRVPGAAHPAHSGRRVIAPPGNGQLDSFQSSRARLVQALRDRRDEIEATIFARVRAVDDCAGAGDAEYVTGLQAAVGAIVEYAIRAASDDDDTQIPIPSIAIEQARLAARAGVSLDTVLLRYRVGLREFEGFVIDAAENASRRVLRDVLGTQWSLIERLMAAVPMEYRAECERLGSSSERRRAERVRRLLAGDLAELDDLEYGFRDSRHTAFIAVGPRAREAVRDIALLCGGQLLTCPHSENTVWAWLCGPAELLMSDVDLRSVPALGATGMLLAVGEPAPGIEGWRLTHHQAQGALLVALRTKQKITRYASVMLLAAALQNATLARSLSALYLDPLAAQKDGGVALRDTLTAYFNAQGNAATTASALGVDRHTVLRRLRSIEQVLDQRINSCQGALETALRLYEVDTARSNASCTNAVQSAAITATHRGTEASFSSGAAE